MSERAASNGRDHLVDAYQEALDLAVYLRAEIARRGNLNATGPHPPPGGVPAARPEVEPGAAAVLPLRSGAGAIVAFVRAHRRSDGWRKHVVARGAETPRGAR